ncbi:hypothetical protein HPP92_019805 [Vanilla planifolia]|uniref:Piriformospora indica-insensitive protein 2 n=1 Tax=Vanilla planifolia TaxID=51239 RepID=A0A835UN87_VANPL|nr:hypothetical protein HPP92_019805 [Vanilla planifolia]
MSRRSIAPSAVLFLLFFLLCFQVLSQTDGSAALMEEKEKQALYSMIQGFVGTWWNGSQLYPDPCGWTPIQGVSCDLFANGMWYVTVVSIGPIFDNSLECAKDAEFSTHLFELGHLRSLSIFNCFSASDDNPVTIPAQNWSKLSSTLENLEFRLNRGLSGEIPAGLGGLVNLQTLVLTDNSF